MRRRCFLDTANTPSTGGPREGDTPFRAGGASFLLEAGRLHYHNVAPFLSAVLSLANRKFTVTPQLRLEVLSWIGDFGGGGDFRQVHVLPEPRLALRWEPNRAVALKGSLGVYHQAPLPAELFGRFGAPDLVPQAGWAYVAGVDVQPLPRLTFELDGFYKDLRTLVSRGERPGDPPLVNNGIGRVYGAQLLARITEWYGLYGWISYTISRSERKDHADSPWRVFQFDQTHIFTAVASWKFLRGYQVGARFRYVTGNPYTPVERAYLNANGGNYVPVYGGVYSGRLPDFHQLDVRFDKTWTFKTWSISAYLDVQNIYYRKNTEQLRSNYNFTKFEPVVGIPLFPALGLRGDF